MVRGIAKLDMLINGSTENTQRPILYHVWARNIWDLENWRYISPAVGLPTLQRTNAENSKQIFPEKEMRGHSSNFHINVSVSDLNVPTIDLPILLQEKYVDRSWEYTNRWQTYECGNWDWGRAIPRKGIRNT